MKGRGVKEGGLFNVQPMSKWDTIFFYRKKGEEGWRWQCGGVVGGGWRMKGGSAGENFGCPWRGDRKKEVLEINTSTLTYPPPKPPHTHTPFQPPGNLGQSRYH